MLSPGIRPMTMRVARCPSDTVSNEARDCLRKVPETLIFTSIGAFDDIL